MSNTRPFLKWAGNKYRCLQHILLSLPPSSRLIEPFVGSAAVFLNTSYPDYLLGEANRDLVDLFHLVQQEGDDFISYCRSFFTKDNNESSAYYDIRQQFNACQNKRQRAAMFLYLNRHGYNGLCRYNQTGGYNVPFGRYAIPYFPHKEMQAFHQKSQKATIIHSDFRQTFKKAKSGDVIYCDPPYAPIKQSSNFSSYTDTQFGEAEQVILAELARNAAHKGMTVIISNHDTDFTRYHYRDSHIQSFSVKRHISCKKNDRKPAKELLAVFC